MMDYIHLSATTPCSEACAQLGTDHYMRIAKMEAPVYIDQLNRVFGQHPTGTRFLIVHCPHDFGIYLDIKFAFDDEDQRHVACMSQVEKRIRNVDYYTSLRSEQHEFNSKEDFSEDPWEEYIDGNRTTGHGNECLSDADSGL